MERDNERQYEWSKVLQKGEMKLLLAIFRFASVDFKVVEVS